MDEISLEWYKQAWKKNYPYSMTWDGVPILQYPQDIVGIHEVIWKTTPSIIIECGVAYGGLSLMMNQLDTSYIIGIEKGLMEETIDRLRDTDVELIEGSTLDSNMLTDITSTIWPEDRVMVILDSNHTHDHVLKELEIYSKLVTKGCYLIVQDTIIEFMPDDYCEGKPYGKGNNPHTAVMEFLKTTDRFEIDKDIENRLGITCAPDGWLKCVK